MAEDGRDQRRPMPRRREQGLLEGLLADAERAALEAAQLAQQAKQSAGRIEVAARDARRASDSDWQKVHDDHRGGMRLEQAAEEPRQQAEGRSGGKTGGNRRREGWRS